MRDSRGGRMMIGENEAARVSHVQVMNPCAHHGYELTFHLVGHLEPQKGLKRGSGKIRFA